MLDFKMMSEIIKAENLMYSDFYAEIKSFSKDGFLMFLGNLIDQYGADNNMSSEETCEILETLSTIQKEVHAELGSAVPIHEQKGGR